MAYRKFHKGESIGEVVQELIDAYQIKGKLNEVKIHEVWAECVGKVASKHTSKLFLKGTKLFVEFSTPLLKHEVHFRKADLLKLLEEKMGEGIVQDIVLI